VGVNREAAAHNVHERAPLARGGCPECSDGAPAVWVSCPLPRAGVERRRFDQEREPGADPNGGRVPMFRASSLIALAPLQRLRQLCDGDGMSIGSP
jgi:hypothetical protein